MYDFFALKRERRRLPVSLAEDREARDAFLIALLLTGVLLGSVIGVYAGETSAVLPDVLTSQADDTASFASAFREAGAYFLLFAVCATSYLGLLMTPALLLLRGYTLSCAVAAVFAAERYRGLLAALLITGIPALLTVPPMVILASDSFRRSHRLLQFRLSRRVPPMQSGDLIRHWFFTAAMIAADTIYIYFIRPRLLMLL